MKIVYCSDLHLDNYKYGIGYDLVKNTTGADVLLVIGDIAEYALNHHSMFYDYVSHEYKHVIIVEGNHEFYFSDYKKIIDNKIYPCKHDNVHILRNNSIIIEDVLFYGGTLWSNLSNLSELDKFVIKQMISDFSVIKYDGSGFCPEYMLPYYNEFVDNLYNEVIYGNVDINKKIVLSHFAPSRKSIATRFLSSNLSPYFCNDMDNLVIDSKANFWLHGHTHDSFDYMLGNTNVLCNPRGYPNENKSIYTPKEIII